MKTLISNIIISCALLMLGYGHTFSQCNTTLAHWNFDNCTKGNMIRDGLPPIITPAGCPNVTTSISRVDLKNSCAARAAANDANCLGGNDLLAWQDGADDAVVITVSFPAGSMGRLGGLSFIQGLHDIAEFNGDPNNPPTRWGIRVVKNGTEIFQEIDKTFTLNAWVLRTFDWSTNPAFLVTGATTFQIELLGYLPSTTINPTAMHNIWELDEVIVTGGCCTITPACNLANANLTSVVCKNNGTTSVPTDDYIEFRLNPTGTGLGTQYTVSVNSGTVTPTTANYGTTTIFRLQNGSAGGGNKTITIKDKASPSCTRTVTITDPGPCSSTPACSITAKVSNVTCNNNSTTSNSSDDRIVFQLNVTGTGTASTYNVSVQGGGTITPTSAAYGSTVTFTMATGTAGGGNKTIIITDATSSTCTVSKLVPDPGSCSAACAITANVSNTACNNNTTPSLSGDDRITFTLNATGNGIASTYNVSVQGGGTISPTSGSYGSNVNFTLATGTAGGGNKTIIITDASTGSCIKSVVVTDPGTCSVNCPTTEYHICNSESYTLTAPTGFTNYQWMRDTGTGYTNVSGGNTRIIVVSTAGNYKFTATDGSGCDIELCCPFEITKTTLTGTGIGTSIMCNDNGTETDPLDDKITFTLNPTGTGLSGSYNVSVQGGGSITPTSASYGVATTFTLAEGSAGGGNKVIVIADSDHPTCTINANITDPDPCSCTLSLGNLSGVSCNNNGTAGTTSDDRIKFNLNPNGIAGESYTVTVNSGSIFPTSGIYGMTTMFTLNAGSAGGGNKIVTITDDSDPNCTVTVNITDPGPCSSCQFNDPVIAYTICDTKGTATTADDDFILYTNPGGLGLGASYNVSVSCSGAACTCSRNNVPYGTPQQICRLPQGFGIATVTITDASGISCQVIGTTAEGDCGPSCNLSASGINIVCNGTTSYSIFLNPTGSGLGTRYHVTGGYNFAFAPYGIPYAIVVDEPINSGIKNITITDANSATCTLPIAIPNQTCAAVSCTLAVQCNPNQQTSCTPPNGSATTTVTGGQGNITYLWSSGETTSGITGKSAGSYTVTVTDDFLAGCTSTCVAVVASTTSNPTAVCTPTPNSNCATPNGAASVSTNATSATYLWSNSATTSSISGLTAGSYTVTVTNTATGCTNTCVAVVASTTSNPTAVCTPTPNSNCTTPNGAASVSTNATSATYLWSNSATTSSISGLAAGTYTVTVTNTTTGCTNTCVAVVASTTSLPTAVCTPTPNTNCTTPNGAASVSTNATSVTYLWSNAATTSSISGLAAGSYTVTVTNTATGCTNSCEAVVTNGTVNPTCSIAVNSQPSCASLTGGSVTVSPSPAGSYTYLWSNSATTATVSGLVGGTYTVTVTNTATSCTGVCSVTLTTPTGCCNINAIVPTNLECLDNNTPELITDNRIRFSANVTNSNLTLTSYNVTINGGTTITPNTNVPYGITQFTLGAGTAGGGSTFTITVTDSTTPGCTQTFQVTDPGNCTPGTPECSPIKCGTATIQVNGN